MYLCLLPVVHLCGLRLEYDKLTRMVQRQQSVAEPVPPFYVRTFISLEVALNAALAKEKGLNASNACALTAMKQKVRKTVKEHEKEIRQYNDEYNDVHGPCGLLTLLAAYCLPGSGGI